jgi:hypothetical protein
MMLVAIALIANTGTNMAFAIAMYKWAKRQSKTIQETAIAIQADVAQASTNIASAAASIAGMESQIGEFLDRAIRASQAFHGGESTK